MTKKKIVVKVGLNCDKCRIAAMTVAASAGGVDSVALEGADKDQLVVKGEGVDSVCLTRKLRKKLCYACIVTVEDVKEEKKEEKEKEKAPEPAKYCYYPAPCPPQIIICDEPITGCTLM